MGKFWDLMNAKDWKDYRQIRTLREGEQLMKTLKQKELSAPVQKQNVKSSKIQINKCPKCKKGNMVVETRFIGGFGRRTIFKSFCPVCGHTIRKEV
jgi:membrane protease subunit (stomatin/prohibitin family)